MMRKTTGVGVATIAIGISVALVGLIQKSNEIATVATVETGLTIWDWAIGIMAGGVIVLILDWWTNRQP